MSRDAKTSKHRYLADHYTLHSHRFLCLGLHC